MLRELHERSKIDGWVGNELTALQIGIFADADYAECGQSLRSTSGSHMLASGSHTRFPLAGGSKRQGCVRHSTPEAEIIAADYAQGASSRSSGEMLVLFVVPLLLRG